MKYSICIYSKITTNNFQKEYVYAHLLNNRDAWHSNDNKQTIFSTDHKFTTNSTNHTYVNDVMVKAGSEMVLSDGDRVCLGDEEFEFKLC